MEKERRSSARETAREKKLRKVFVFRELLTTNKLVYTRNNNYF